VLTARGDILELGLQTSNLGKLRLIRQVAFSKDSFGSRGADLVAALVNDEEQIFVSALAGDNGLIRRYDLDGQQLEVYRVPFLGAGFDIDVNGHRLFVANSLTNEIASIDLISGRAAIFTKVEGGHNLGPLVVSLGKGSLFVADQRTGVVIEVAMRDGQTKGSVTSVEIPVALAFDEQYQTLFVANAQNGEIVRASIGARNRILKPIETNLRTVTGVAPGPLGSVFVADADTLAVYNISVDGKLLHKWSIGGMLD